MGSKTWSTGDSGRCRHAAKGMALSRFRVIGKLAGDRALTVLHWARFLRKNPQPLRLQNQAHNATICNQTARPAEKRTIQMPSSPPISSWIESLQSQGRYTFTRAQFESDSGRSQIAARTALGRLKKQGRITSPGRGFYIIVPPEYRAVGSPPASWFIDDLMRNLAQPYYVGLLSAAALHGAAHQQPMVFQVVTAKSTREMRTGNVAIRFSRSRKVEQMPVTEIQTETGVMRVATPETTAFDLVRYPASSGHLSNVATVLSELAERMDGRALFEVADLVRVPDVQRLGYLLDSIGENDLAEPLARWLHSRRYRAIGLAPGISTNVNLDKLWRVYPNVKLETDL